MIAATPPDQTSAITKLTERRNHAVASVAGFDRDIDALPRPPVIRQRSAARHRRHHLDSQRAGAVADVEHLDTQHLELQAAQHRRDSYIAAHTADTDQLDRLNREITHRITRAYVRSANKPPSYIVEQIGTRPDSDHPADTSWLAAVHAIETYRAEHDITDPTHTTSGQTHAGNSLVLWYRMRNTIDHARRHLGLDPGAPGATVATVGGPSLGR